MNKLLEKLKQFFNRLKSSKKLLLEEVDIVQNENHEDKKVQFKEKLNMQEEQELLRLQNKYEKEKISRDDLETLEIMNLIKLYRKQIDEMNLEISLKQEKLNKV